MIQYSADLAQWQNIGNLNMNLTHTQLEMHGVIINTVATDVLVLKHQAMSSHNADRIFIVLDQFHTSLVALMVAAP